MKQSAIVLIAILVVLGLAPMAQAQQSDMSVWTRPSKNADPIYFPWFVFMGQGENRHVFDVRYNFDLRDTAGIFYGRRLWTSVR